jgi:hypothetical protein
LEALVGDPSRLAKSGSIIYTGPVHLNQASVRKAPYVTARQSQRPDIGPFTLSIEAKLRRAGKGKRLVIANGAEAEVNAGLVELIKDAFTIRIRLLSGSDDASRR